MQFNKTQPEPLSALVPPDTHLSCYSSVATTFYPTLAYKSQGSDYILAELIQAGHETLRSEIHKLTNSIWNKE
jgi:hypothetical protein